MKNHFYLQFIKRYSQLKSGEFHGTKISDMRKKIIILFFTGLSVLSKGQVTVSVQLPPAGQIQKDQLWNLVLVNNSNEILDATLLLNLQDAMTGQTVLSAVTGSILLQKGVKVLSMQDIQPVQYNFIGTDFMGNYLPMGSYIACYRLNKYTHEGGRPLADECVRVNISPLSPPLLITPADKSLSESVYPQFTWVPPAPLDMFSNLNYDLSVTEVLEGQSPMESMLYNNPVYVKSNLKTSFENFPASYARLDTGKLYAWQVTAKNGMSYSAKTEVWTFRIKQTEGPKEKPVNTSYILVSRNKEITGINYIEESNLYIKYYSFDAEHLTTIRFLNTEGMLLQEVKQKIIYGDNFFNLKLERSFQQGKQYIIEIIDQQNISHTALFGIK
jgi:hypothetical protein